MHFFDPYERNRADAGAVKLKVIGNHATFNECSATILRLEFSQSFQSRAFGLA
jgi:hypothetical protein